MSGMKDLFGDELYVEAPYVPLEVGNPLEEAFVAFHKENPQVYALFDRFAKEAIARGRSRFSVSMIFERMRWHTTIETNDQEFKLNNNHRAYYARFWMQKNPQHEGLFETRSLTAEKEK